MVDWLLPWLQYNTKVTWPLQSKMAATTKSLLCSSWIILLLILTFCTGKFTSYSIFLKVYKYDHCHELMVCFCLVTQFVYMLLVHLQYLLLQRHHTCIDCASSGKVNHEFHETCHSVTSYLMQKRLQTMLWHLNARVNSHQRWKQTRFRVCFHLWCELTSTTNVTEWRVSWNSWYGIDR